MLDWEARPVFRDGLGTPGSLVSGSIFALVGLKMLLADGGEVFEGINSWFDGYATCGSDSIVGNARLGGTVSSEAQLCDLRVPQQRVFVCSD